MLVKFIMVAENSQGSPVGICGKSDFFTFRSEKSFSVFNSPINIAGDRLDILFHFPNDCYNNIDGLVEKIKIDFLHVPNMHKYTQKWSFLCIFVYIWYRQKINFDFFDQPVHIIPIIRKVEKDVLSVSSYIYRAIKHRKTIFQIEK